MQSRPFAVGAHGQRALRDYGNPIEVVGRNGRMNVVGLVFGGRRPIEQSESGVRERAMALCTRSPIDALHEGIIAG